MAMTRGHGGDTVGFWVRYGSAPLDFSVNTNPQGMPPAAVRAAVDALRDAAGYPDPECRALRRAIAAREDADPASILCGNGAADLIYRLAQARRPGRALLTAPAFSEYERALRAVGCEIDFHSLHAEEDFKISSDILEKITPEVEVLFLCEPANPTGQVTPRALLLDIARRCAQTGTLLVVDECFNGFLDAPEAHTLVPQTAGMENLFILKAFTKFYAMAGLRLGYGICADKPLLERIHAAGQPWPVSNIAQAAGVAALADEDYIFKTRALVSEERCWLAARLAEQGCRIYGSKANFIFFSCDNTNLYHQLAGRGLLIRDCANYKGLGPGYYRVAVRAREDNEKLAAALSACLGGAEGAV